VFDTDRGPVSLTAWKLESDQALGPIWVLDPAVESTEWTPPQPPTNQPARPRPSRILGHATLVGDSGTRLMVTLTGGPPQWVDYPSVEVFESDCAVVLIPVAHDTGPSGNRTLAGFARDAVAELSRPLGDRVLLSPDATAVALVAS
jgi:hypothetical protein